MPIYEYVCQDCGTRFDMLRSMKDADSPVHCKNCSSEHATRQLSVFFSSNSSREMATATSSSSGCAGCSGGSCGSCHH